MKKKHFSALIFLISCAILYGQERNEFEHYLAVNTPEATAFSEVNFLPINEYTGKPEIKIPIYTIQMGSLNIPIELTYNYGGVKVNSIASQVGTNWSLYAGGSIVREVNGINDFFSSPSVIGLMRYPQPDTGGTCYGNAFLENEPDIYRVKAAGLNTSFISERAERGVRDSIPGIELTPTGTKVEFDIRSYFHQSLEVLEEIGTGVCGEDPTINCDYEPVRFRLTSNNGLHYEFANINSTTTVRQQVEFIDGEPYIPPYPFPYVRWTVDYAISSVDLTRVYDPITSKEVKFEYSTLPIAEYDFEFVRKAFELNKKTAIYNAQRNYAKSKRLNKIDFDHGTVEFFYDFVRNDVPNPDNIRINNNALTRILIKNKYKKVIKDVRLRYENVPSVENCDDPSCFRLFLNGVDILDENQQRIAGYDLAYNSQKLPKRYSYKQDFLGFYNGATVSSDPAFDGEYVPITYHYPNQGVASFLPIDIGDANYTRLNGNYTLASAENFARAGILERITYPTGGYVDFISESHQFKYLNTTITGGGLRIKEQNIYNADQSLERSVQYSYTDTDGSSSGFITTMPKYNDYHTTSQAGIGGLKIYQINMANQKLTNASFVGYSKVKIEEIGNGYTIKEYTSPMEYPNTIGTWDYKGILDEGESLLDERIANGCFPKIVTDKDILRGKLKQASIYDENDQLLKRTTNSYIYKKYEALPIFGGVPYRDLEDDGCSAYPVLYERAFLNIERNMLASSEEVNYHADGNSTSTTVSYVYEDDYPFIKQKGIIDSDQNSYKEVYTYAYDSPFHLDAIENCSTSQTKELKYLHDRYLDLVAENRIATPIHTLRKMNSRIIDNTLSIYQRYNVIDKNGNPIAGQYLVNGSPLLQRRIRTKEKHIYKKRLSFEVCELIEEGTDLIIEHYGANGEVLEMRQLENSTPYLLLWGYKNEHLIVKIENASADELPQEVNLLLGQVRTLSNTEHTIAQENELREKIDAIRNHPALKNAQVTSYTYDPLIGLTSTTDPKGVYDVLYL